MKGSVGGARGGLASALRVAAAWLGACLMAGFATAQVPTYLAEVASDPSVTRDAARLLHYLPGDMPVLVHVPTPDGEGGSAKRAAVLDALNAWEQAAGDLLSFLVVGEAGEGVLDVRWVALDDRVGSYRYRFEVTDGKVYRFRATALLLDPRASASDLQRYALLQVGHAIGLLGRSPFIGDAMSAVPSGRVTQRDVATLRALYALPSGTELRDAEAQDAGSSSP